MPTKKPAGGESWVDPDDAPELTDEFFERAEIRIGGKIVRRGRPPIPHPKEAIKLRLSPEVLEHFRATGPGWQTRINDTLKRSIRRAKPAPKRAPAAKRASRGRA